MICRLHVPLVEPEDVIPHLAKQELHWRAGFSARSGACSGMVEFPARFSGSGACGTQDRSRVCSGRVCRWVFEREVELGSPGRNSQTDLMVIAGLDDELGIIAVEGKVEESFAELVADWNSTPGKQRGLAGLCETLGLDATQVGGIGYQLLH